MTERRPFRYFRISPEIMRLAVMMYVRFQLSLRNVEDLLQGAASRSATSGALLVAVPRPHVRGRDPQEAREWNAHLTLVLASREVFVKVSGGQHYLRRAADHAGEVLEAFVTKTRDKTAALKFLKKLMKRHGLRSS